MKKYILALDQGTTSSRAVLFDKQQNLAGMVQREFTQIFPREGWVEHNPMEIYSSQYGVMVELLAQYNIPAAEIAAIGISNQRETTILWDKHTGVPVYNAIVWQCRRSAGIVDWLKNEGLGDYIKKTTGLVADAYFSATKIKWLFDNIDGLRQRAEHGGILFGTVDTWLLWKLTQGAVHATDYTNASRTMLYNINTLDWDTTLLEKLDIPRACLPEVKPSGYVYGTVKLADGEIPITSIAGDQQAALFGQCCFEKGEAKNTYGTGCFLLMNSGSEPCDSKSGLITTIAAGTSAKPPYALEGSVFTGGAVVQWMRDELRFVMESTDTEYFAAKVPDTGGVYLVPAFTGLGAPYWDMYARGIISGITRGTNRSHIIRAALESIAFQSLDLLKAMENDTGAEITSLKVDGGACKNNFLMQFQADILSAAIERPAVQETTALGAASLAGLAVGFWSSQSELKKLWKSEKVFCPVMEESRRKELINGWHKAVGRCLIA